MDNVEVVILFCCAKSWKECNKSEPHKSKGKKEWLRLNSNYEMFWHMLNFFLSIFWIFNCVQFFASLGVQCSLTPSTIFCKTYFFASTSIANTRFGPNAIDNKKFNVVIKNRYRNTLTNALTVNATHSYCVLTDCRTNIWYS